MVSSHNQGPSHTKGGKVRPIDDLARSLVNSAASVEDLVVPTGVDAVAGLARVWAEELRESSFLSSLGELGGGRWTSNLLISSAGSDETISNTRYSRITLRRPQARAFFMLQGLCRSGP